jgi:RNA polymerase sigma factor for flagellar operon FliA
MKHDHTAFASAAGYSTASREVVEDRVRRFLPMVRRAAWHIHGGGSAKSSGGLEVEDLIQTGIVALTECAQRHAGPSEDGFAAYAKIRVRGAMLDCLRKGLHDTRTARKRRAAYEATVERLRQQTGSHPSRAAIARAMQISDAELLEIEGSGVSLTSISEEYDDANTAFASEEPDPFEALCEAEDRDRLVRAMTGLPDRLKLVLQLFYVEEMNLTEIAQVIDVSVPRVHQLRAKALTDLRAAMEAEMA